MSDAGRPPEPPRKERVRDTSRLVRVYGLEYGMLSLERAPGESMGDVIKRWARDRQAVSGG